MDKLKYDKIKERLKGFVPELEDEKELVTKIISSIDDSSPVNISDTVINILFGWTNLLWVRRSFAVVSGLIVFIFLFQQANIINRINLLEGRMVGGNTQNIIEYQQHKVTINSLMNNSESGTSLNDSIVVADKDLRELINSYTALQKRYDDLQERVRISLNRGKTAL